MGLKGVSPLTKSDWLITHPISLRQSRRQALIDYFVVFQIPSTYLPVYLSTYLPIYLPIYLSTYLPTYLSIYPSIRLSIYPSIHLSIYPSIHLSIYPSIDRSIDPSIHRSIDLSIYRSTLFYPILFYAILLIYPTYPIYPICPTCPICPICPIYRIYPIYPIYPILSILSYPILSYLYIYFISISISKSILRYKWERGPSLRDHTSTDPVAAKGWAVFQYFWRLLCQEGVFLVDVFLSCSIIWPVQRSNGPTFLHPMLMTNWKLKTWLPVRAISKHGGRPRGPRDLKMAMMLGAGIVGMGNEVDGHKAPMMLAASCCFLQSKLPFRQRFITWNSDFRLFKEYLRLRDFRKVFS